MNLLYFTLNLFAFIKSIDKQSYLSHDRQVLSVSPITTKRSSNDPVDSLGLFPP